VRSGKISECGSKAVLAAVDGFHDKPIEGLRGWPDLETGPSVVRHFKQSTTVTFTEDGQSLMIYSWPILNERVTKFCSRHGNIIDSITTGISTDGVVAPLTITPFTAAQSMAASLPFNGMQPATFTHKCPANYLDNGNARLIGQAFEVHDVTADLYKQGTLTVFEIPQTIADVENVQTKPLTFGATAVAATAIDVVELDRYPSSLADIMTYPSTRQWDCKQGAYVVIPFTGHENPPTSVRYQVPWINTNPGSSTDSTDPLVANTIPRAIGNVRTPVVLNEPMEFLPNQYAPTNSRGVYLTGLNAKSAITITSSFFVESFPVQSSELLPLAAPSCPFDPKALALISMIMKTLPVGVPLNDNFSSEWFWEAVEAALPVLGVVGSALFPEFSPMIMGASAAASRYATKQLGRPNPVNKQKKQKLKKEVRQLVKEDVKALSTAPRQRRKPLPPVPSQRRPRK
jgi:hypothetical protein